MSKNFSKKEFLFAIDKYQLPSSLSDTLFKYYSTLPFINETQNINILLHTFGEIILQDYLKNKLERHLLNIRGF